MIRLLIVDDSVAYCELLEIIFSNVPDITIVGVANSGRDAIKKAADLRPDVITMDVNMPDMNGYDTTDAILQTLPVPIVMISALNRNHENDFNAMRAGAVAVIEKPGLAADCDYEHSVKAMIHLIRNMSKVKVFRRYNAPKDKKSSAIPLPEPVPGCEIAAIGISTGGPPILAGMLKLLPASLPFPICIIQHIPKGFSDSLIGWLGKVSPLPVVSMANGDTLLPGTVYIAPGGSVVSLKTPKTFSVVPETQINTPSPSVNIFFDSLNKFYGPKALAVLMSGMGRDGAQGLLHLFNSGAETVVQDRESAVVYGMPEEALKLKAAKHVMTPDEIVGFIRKLAVSNR